MSRARIFSPGEYDVRSPPVTFNRLDGLLGMVYVHGMKGVLIAAISMVALASTAHPPPILIAHGARSIAPHGDQWLADGRAYFTTGTITVNGQRWARSGSRWTLAGEPLTYFERRGARWTEWVNGEQVGEIIQREEEIVHRRGTRVIATYNRHQDGSLHRQQVIPVPPIRARQPSRFERSLTRGRLHNP